LGKKNPIALICGILIVIGFVSELGFHNEFVAILSLGTASVLGVAPIAIQAYQALRVKVVISMYWLPSRWLVRGDQQPRRICHCHLPVPVWCYLEQRTLNKTRSAIKELTEMAPENALKRMEDGGFEEVDVDEVDVGDVLLVKTGAKIPVDGTVNQREGPYQRSQYHRRVPPGWQEGSC
jgi:Cd2+/Zn2+-exporting ATPase